MINSPIFHHIAFPDTLQGSKAEDTSLSGAALRLHLGAVHHPRINLERHQAT